MSMRNRAAFIILAAAGLALLAGGCSLHKSSSSGSVTAVTIPAASMDYIVLAWAEQGTHAMNAAYSSYVFTVPYTTIKAQVLKRGNPPELVTAGIRVEYSFADNTYSYGKTYSTTSSYSGFWDNSSALFGTSLAQNTGLNFTDSSIHNGLSGALSLNGSFYEVDGVPLTPVNDSGTWSPYQTAKIVVYDEESGVELASTECMAAVSDEIGCNGCHDGDTYDSVLLAHDTGTIISSTTTLTGTDLVDSAPVNCSSCHGTAALGVSGTGTAGYCLSYSIHYWHAYNSTAEAADAVCLNCHPGADNTMFNRSTAHYASNGNCTDCHYALGKMATTISGSSRVPWSVAGEPKCATCHTFVAEVDTGTTVHYSSATGHGGVACAACHGPAHAQVPSKNDGDNYMFTQYQNKALPLGSCRVCHSASKGGGLNAFMTSAHVSTEKTACYVCHTAAPATNNPVNWPHKFQFRNRTS